MNKKTNLRKKIRRKNPRPILLATVAYAFGIGASILLSWVIQPSISNVIYKVQQNDEESQIMESDFPFSLSDAPKSNIDVAFTLRTGALRPSMYHVLADDCLDRLIINSQVVIDDSLPVCDYTNGTVIDLSSYLKERPNTVTAIIGNNGGATRFSMTPSSKDPVFWLPFIVFTLSTLAFFGMLAFHLSSARKEWMLYILFSIAVAIRIFYTSITPYWVRGHDTDGHIEYIEHLATHWTIPDPSKGWEFWQPPLYYAFNAIFYAGAEFLGTDKEFTLKMLQYISVFLSILMLVCVLFIAKELFPKEKHGEGRSLFFMLCALLPSYIFLSARINNDVLATLLSFISVLLLLQHWKKGRITQWLLLSASIGLGILSKNTALLIAAASFATLLVHPLLPWKKKVLQGAAGIAVIGIVAGWFSLYRIMHPSEQEYMVGNIAALNSALRVENTIPRVITFNPVEIIKHPFNEPWSDTGRRQYFWEYWYKSSFFGEFMFDSTYFMLAVWVLLSSFTLIPLGIWGLWKIIGNKKSFKEYLPLIIVCITLTIGALAFRIKYPYASSQDFRYVLPLIVPWYFFVAYGALSINKGKEVSRMRTVAIGLIIAHSALCTMFVLSL